MLRHLGWVYFCSLGAIEGEPYNLARLAEMITFTERSGAQRLEIANVQHYGWAFRNREALLPTREQIGRSIETVEAARERLKGRLRIDFVLPDYYAKYPKPCMNGWGTNRCSLTLPGAYCHAMPHP